MDRLNSLMTNTTSLVGYIAVLIIAGAYIGGSPNIEATALKWSLFEASLRENAPATHKAIVTIDGKTYEAWIQGNAKAGEMKY